MIYTMGTDCQSTMILLGYVLLLPLAPFPYNVIHVTVVQYTALCAQLSLKYLYSVCVLILIVDPSISIHGRHEYGYDDGICWAGSTHIDSLLHAHSPGTFGIPVKGTKCLFVLCTAVVTSSQYHTISKVRAMV